ncbi:IS110 family transposase [Arthrobacter sp.]|uniref:IS110 family transposase n=1 Tax=Arthrobacter sp. TaxID=1667 RepID=UPI002590D734|nr:IS110 family transposase [Arthrobacter sp.]
MNYVGLDCHQHRSSICILDPNGKIVKQQTVHGRWPQVIDVMAQLPRPFSVCFEASAGYGWLHEKLSPLAQRVAVAHPGQLRLIFRSKAKHDRVDAQKLAKLLYLDEVPPVHVPNLDVRQWRKFIEFRQTLLGQRTAAKNQVRAVLRSNAVTAPKSAWSRRGRRELLALALPAADQLSVELALDQIDHLNLGIKRVEKELARIGDAHPGVTLLRTIPGVGIRTAEAFCAYVDDVRRFARGRQVAAYFGLVPCLDSSAGKDRFGHITRQGPATVRKLLTEAAWQGIRRSPTIRSFFQRVTGQDPDRRKIALIATGHYLCRVMTAMLRSGQSWQEKIMN